MPITISYQKQNDSLNVAYRPIVFRCKASISGATVDNYKPPVVYCDVYVGGVYYKSLSRTQPLNDDGTAPEYEFDIQDAVQEIMTYNLPAMNGSLFLEFGNTLKKISVKFRNAKYDSNGFINSEQLVPIQGTSSSEPVSGGGVVSNEIYITNSTLQHEDNQNFEAFLSSYRTGEWSVNSYPLTKRPKVVKLCKNDSSYFPIITDKEISCLELFYKKKGQNTFQSASFCEEIPVVFTIDDVMYKTVEFTPGEPLESADDLFNLPELLVGLYNSTGNPTSGIKILSLVSRGEITNDSVGVAVNDIISVADISADKLTFWAQGADGTQPDGSYIDSFTFRAIDTDGNESNISTFMINAVDMTVPVLHYQITSGNCETDLSGAVWTDIYLPPDVTLGTGAVIYADEDFTTPYDGGGTSKRFRKIIDGSWFVFNQQYRVSTIGVLYNRVECATPAELTISSTEPSGNGGGFGGTLDFADGQANETLTLSFTVTLGSSGQFFSVSFGPPVTADTFDNYGMSGTGTVLLDSSGNASSSYQITDHDAKAVTISVKIIGRSSSEPIPIVDDTIIIKA